MSRERRTGDFNRWGSPTHPSASSGPVRGIRPLVAFTSSQVWRRQGSLVFPPRARGMQIVQIGQRGVDVKDAPQFRDGLGMLVHPQVEVRILLVSDHPQGSRYLAAPVSASGLAGLYTAQGLQSPRPLIAILADPRGDVFDYYVAGPTAVPLLRGPDRETFLDSLWTHSLAYDILTVDDVRLAPNRLADYAAILILNQSRLPLDVAQALDAY
jgi:hypothetical protein